MEVLTRMPWLAQDAVFQRLASIAEVASLSKEERRSYDESLKAYRDTVSVMEGQYQNGLTDGMRRGIQQGIQQGAKDANIENARRMKADGMPLELIAKYTGLAPEEIAPL
jgi:predicted transposase/invertase (TIGR01784 family)